MSSPPEGLPPAAAPTEPSSPPPANLRHQVSRRHNRFLEPGEPEAEPEPEHITRRPSQTAFAACSNIVLEPEPEPESEPEYITRPSCTTAAAAAAAVWERVTLYDEGSLSRQTGQLQLTATHLALQVAAGGRVELPLLLLSHRGTCDTESASQRSVATGHQQTALPSMGLSLEGYDGIVRPLSLEFGRASDRDHVSQLLRRHCPPSQGGSHMHRVGTDGQPTGRVSDSRYVATTHCVVNGCVATELNAECCSRTGVRGIGLLPESVKIVHTMKVNGTGLYFVECLTLPTNRVAASTAVAATPITADVPATDAAENWLLRLKRYDDFSTLRKELLWPLASGTIFYR